VTPRFAVVLPLVLGGILASCGYSEDEWQAQLAKYGQLDQAFQAEKKEHAATRAELQQAQQRVADLKSQLEKMGLDLENLSAQLEATGSEKEKLAQSLDQLKRALEEYKQRAAQLEAIKKRFELLRDKLKKLTDLGLKVQIRNNRMVIMLPGDVLFESGKAELKDEGLRVLQTVADVIRNDAQLSRRYFQIAGHTDNKPLGGGIYRDNWGLSVMRAREVLVWLVAPIDAKKGGGALDGSRLHAAGYGETDPVADNATDGGRQSNRRVELVLMPDVTEMLDLKSLI
jgi:chemotaxis protein MotB